MIIFDTETTGLPLPLRVPIDQQPQIIEFCAVKLDKDLIETPFMDCLECAGEGKGIAVEASGKAISVKCPNCEGKKRVAHINFLCNPYHKFPGRMLPPEITKITGITDAMLQGKKPFGFHLPALVEFYLGERYSVAHNNDFDTRLLNFELMRLDSATNFPWPPTRICTVEKSFAIKGRRLKLMELYEIATNGGKLQGAHRAINDVRATAVCIRYLVEKGHVKL